MKKLFLILALMVCADLQAITPVNTGAYFNVNSACLGSGCSTPTQTTVGPYHLITVGIIKGDSSVSCSAVNDSFQLQYSRRFHTTQGSTNMIVEGWDALTGASSASSDTITPTCTGSTAVSMVIAEYPGMALSAVFDQVASGQGDFTNPLDSGNTPATTQATELVIGIGSQGPSSLLTAGTGYTVRAHDETSGGIALEDKTVSSTGTQDAQMGGASGHWIMGVMTYKIFVPGGTSLFGGNLKISGNFKATSASSPILNYSFTSYDFTANYGPFIQGGTYTNSPAVLTLTNVGTVSLTISAMAFSNADYTQTNTCGALPATLTAGASCTVNIVFAPTCGGSCTSTPAADNATLTVTDSSDVGTQTVSLTGQGVSNAGGVLFSDTFETGDFSKWSVSSGFPSDNPFIQMTGCFAGTDCYGQRYEATCCGVGDTNRWIATIQPGANEVWVRGYVYIKSPEADATPPTSSGNGRKMIELGDSNSGSSCCGNWSPILGGFNIQGTTPVNYNNISYTDAPCGYGNETYYNIGQFNFSEWHEVQLHVKLDQGGVGGAQNGVVDIFLDGARKFHTAAEYIRGTCTDNLTGYFIGRQTDSPANTTMDEYRFWDNISFGPAYQAQ